MSPTVFRYKGYRFFFFSREESRMHIHVISADGEAKVWLEPAIELDRSVGYSTGQINEILAQVLERQNDIKNHWEKHFT